MSILFIVVKHLAIQAVSLLVHRHALETKETNVLNKRNIVQNPNWQEAVTEDLNSRLPGNKSGWWQSGGLEPGTSGLKRQRPRPLGQAVFFDA